MENSGTERNADWLISDVVTELHPPPQLPWHNCFTVYSLKIFFLFVCNLWGFFSLRAVKKSWTSSPLNTVRFTGVATLVKAVKQESKH